VLVVRVGYSSQGWFRHSHSEVSVALAPDASTPMSPDAGAVE